MYKIQKFRRCSLLPQLLQKRHFCLTPDKVIEPEKRCDPPSFPWRITPFCLQILCLIYLRVRTVVVTDDHLLHLIMRRVIKRLCCPVLHTGAAAAAQTSRDRHGPRLKSFRLAQALKPDRSKMHEKCSDVSIHDAIITQMPEIKAGICPLKSTALASPRLYAAVLSSVCAAFGCLPIAKYRLPRSLFSG